MLSLIQVSLAVWIQLSICPVELHQLKEQAQYPTCPVEAPKANEALAFSHRTCSKFYTCRRGERLTRKCSVGLFYNHRLAICDFPSNVECRRGAALRNRDDSDDVPDNGVAVGVFSKHHRHPDVGVGIGVFTDRNTLPDDGIAIGVYSKRPTLPDNGIAIGIMPTRPTPNDKIVVYFPTTEPNVLPDDGVVIGDFEKKGDSYYDHPPLWYLYNRYPMRRNLIDELLSTMDDGKLPNGCPRDPTVHWLTAHPISCALFYYCQLGSRVLRSCSRGLYFNPDTQMCDWPQKVKCFKVVEY